MRVIAALLAATVYLGAWVAAAHGQVPSGDSVIAQGTTEEFQVPIDPFTTAPAYFVFDINATSEPSGESAAGHVVVDLSLAGHWEGQVTCLNVQGNEAIVGTEGSGSFGGDRSQKFLLADNGSPRSRAARHVRGRIRDPRLWQ